MLTINEASTADSNDWVEIYNSKDAAPIDLSQYRIRDSSSKNKKDLQGNIVPDGFYVVDFRNWLNNSGDSIKLLKVNGAEEQIIDQIVYGKGGICLPKTGESIGRLPDGSQTIVRFVSPSKGATNNQSVDDCHEPEATKLNSPQPIALVTPSPIIVATTRELSLQTPLSSPTPFILGVQTIAPTTTTLATTTSPQAPVKSSSGLYLGAAFLILGIAILVSVLFFKSRIRDIINKFGKSETGDNPKESN